MAQYNHLIVGAGLYGAVFAQQAHAAGRSALVIDKRSHIAGNVYTEDVEDIRQYGAPIFHTNDKRVWGYINRFATFSRLTNSPVANCRSELYSLPFNMYTFNWTWGVVTDIYERLVKGYTEKRWGRDCKDLPAFIIKWLPVRLTFARKIRGVFMDA